MSSQNKSYSYTSSSSSYSSSSTSNGQTTGQAYRETTHSNPSGTRVQTTSRNLGEMPVQETRYFDDEGREVLEDGRTLGTGKREGEAGRIMGVEELDEGGKVRE